MNCPYCAEKINEAAIVCRYCNRDFSPLKPLTERLAELEEQIKQASIAPPSGTDDSVASDTSVLPFFLRPSPLFLVSTLAATAAFIYTAAVSILGYSLYVTDLYSDFIQVSFRTSGWSLLLIVALGILIPFLTGAWIGKRLPGTLHRKVLLSAISIGVGIALGLVPSTALDSFLRRSMLVIYSIKGIEEGDEVEFDGVQITQGYETSVLGTLTYFFDPWWSPIIVATFVCVVFVTAATLMVFSGRILGGWLRRRSIFGGEQTSARHLAERVLGPRRMADVAGENRLDRLTKVFVALGPLLTFLAAILGSILTFVATLWTASSKK